MALFMAAEARRNKCAVDSSVGKINPKVLSEKVLKSHDKTHAHEKDEAKNVMPSTHSSTVRSCADPPRAVGCPRNQKSLCTLACCVAKRDRHFAKFCPVVRVQRAEQAARLENSIDSSTTAATWQAERAVRIEKSTDLSTPANWQVTNRHVGEMVVELFFSDLEVRELRKHLKLLGDCEKLEKLPKLDKLQLEKLGRKQTVMNSNIMKKHAAGYKVRNDGVANGTH